MTDEGSFSFRDIEESLESFNGECGKDIIAWLKEYDDISVMCKWNDIQKYLYARRLLKGAARLAVEASTEVHSWKELKQVLLNEFSTSTSCITLHRELESRKKLARESYLEYVYTMKSIASKGNMDEESIVAYIISGIPDEPSNKALLYEARTIAELKSKIKAYENMKSQKGNKSHEKSSSSTNASNKKVNSGKTRCTTCGAYSHSNNNCPHKGKGLRCFNCNEFGHISAKCPQPRKIRDSYKSKQSNVNSISLLDSTLKVKLKNWDLIALVDTASDITLIRKTIYEKLSPRLNTQGPSIALTGFGRKVSRTICSTPLNLVISNESYQVQGHVVPDEWLSHDVLIGKDLLKNATLIMENGKATIQRSLGPKRKDKTENFLKNIDVLELIKGDDYPSVEEILDCDLRNEVRELVTNYVPEKSGK